MFFLIKTDHSVYFSEVIILSFYLVCKYICRILFFAQLYLKHFMK